MSIVKLPRPSSYWKLNLNYYLFSDLMLCNRWEHIKRFLHFANNDDAVTVGIPSHDKLSKIRPVIGKLRKQLFKDERSIPTKSHSSLKQLNPKELHI